MAKCISVQKSIKGGWVWGQAGGVVVFLYRYFYIYYILTLILHYIVDMHVHLTYQFTVADALIAVISIYPTLLTYSSDLRRDVLM